MFLLDTNALSELVKKKPRASFLERLRREASRTLFTSSICAMELRYGSSLRADREIFWQRLEREVLARVELLDIGRREALIAGDLLAQLSKRGEKIGLEDLLIASTALAHRLTVVTGNVRHFDRVPDLKVENWFV